MHMNYMIIMLVVHPFIGSIPTMPELVSFKCGDSNINIAREIGCKYEVFGTLLLLDNTMAHIQDLERRFQGNGEQINMHILQEWVEGKGKKPITWTTLLKVINDIGMGELANKLVCSMKMV